MDAGQLVVGNEFTDLLRYLVFLLGGNDLVLAVDLGCLLADHFLVHVQNAAQLGCNEVHVLLGVVDLQRVQKDGLDRGGGGDDLHVAVVDRAAVRRNRRGPGLVADGSGFVLVVIHDHQREQLVEQRQEEQNAADQHDGGGSAQNAVVGLFAVICGAFARADDPDVRFFRHAEASFQGY